MLKIGQANAMWHVVGLTATCLASLAIGTDGAVAESCREQVLRIAKAHDLATDPPTVPRKGNKDVTPRDLAESGGVVEPPAVEDKSVISPPIGQRSPMPTMPDVVPDKPQAANRTTLQAILVAARAEAERNNEAGCREGLARAAQILERME
ncbi:hypothetical protein [Reyranella sp.]|uniref:hypothetical protein n=1 Tax=Reyranella sp. TaxID=1929291 RepID=UPI003783C2C2